MKIPKGQSTQKNKYSKSKAASLDEQINSDDLPSNEEYQKVDTNYDTRGNGTEHLTPQQVKISIAKKLIQKTKNGITKKRQQSKKDNFFIQDPEQAIAIKQATNNFGQSVGLNQDEELNEQLKNEYLRSKNKLYIDQNNYFRNLKISEPVSYKGHTQCITAIQSTPFHIYSVSKDRSIIIWDRETGKKDFITMAKDKQSTVDHEGPILSLAFHPSHQMLATAGEDGKIKLWDIKSKSLIETLKGHRNTVNGLKFGLNSNNLCSVSADRTMKQWDAGQRGIIDTFYGHNAEVLDIDCINQNDFISSGNDHQNIIWKTQKQTQVIYEGHDYAIDRVRCINDQKFISACQDGGINLWSAKKKKPIYKHHNAHKSWIVSLDTIKQSNIFASGCCQGLINIWSVGAELKSFEKIHEIKAKGIVTDLKLNENELIATSCDEHRLGRWITTRVRNQIEVYKFQYN